MRRADQHRSNTSPGEPVKPTNPANPAGLLAFVATTWFAQLPLIIGWNAMLEGGDPGVGLGAITWLAVLASPVVGWAFAKNISQLGVEHAQRPALAATIVVAAIWLGGLHVHLTGAYWLAHCQSVSNADACLGAGDYFDSGEAALQGTIDAKELWADACEGGGEHGWKACRKIVHRVGYKQLACSSLQRHCQADDRSIGACWDWSAFCDRADYLDEGVDKAVGRAPRPDSQAMPGRNEVVTDFERCLDSELHGLDPACDRTLDRGILHQRRAVCDKIETSCASDRAWRCSFANSRCHIYAANPFEK